MKFHVKHISIPLGLAALAVASATPAMAARFTFTLLDVPGQAQTFALGVNDKDEVVGYSELQGTYTNFTWSKGVFTDVPGHGKFTVNTSINDPEWVVGYSANNGGTSTNTAGYAYNLRTGASVALKTRAGYEIAPSGINASGDVVGIAYFTAGEKNLQFGYLSLGGKIEFLSAPGGKYVTETVAINDSGVVAGEFGRSKDNAFIYKNGVFTNVIPPGALATYITFISPSGVVGGSYEDTSFNVHGFTWDGISYTTYDAPNGNSTYIAGVGPQGQVYGGNYGDTGYANASFVFLGGHYYPIGVSLAAGTTTIIEHVNVNGTLVGTYTDANFVNHGFIATCPLRHSPCTR